MFHPSDNVVMFISLEIGCCLVMFCCLYCWVTFISVELGPRFPFGHVLLSDALMMLLALKLSRCLVTFRSLDCLFTFLSLEPGHPMGPEAQNTTL